MSIYKGEIGNIIYEDNLYNSSEIRKQINIIKNLVTKSEIKSDEVIGVMLPRTPWIISTIFALLELKVPFLPIDIKQPEEQLTYMLDNADVKYVITMNKKNNYVFDDRMTYLDINNEESVLNEERDIVKSYNSDIAYVLYTSGSTGKPKGVEVTRKGLENFIKSVPKIIDFSKDKTIACFTSHTFDIFFLESVLALSRGLTIVLANEEEQKNPKLIINLIKKNNIEMIQMTPSRMKLISECDNKLDCLKDIKEIMIGGEAFPANLLSNLQKFTNARIYNMYGPTEATIWATISELTNKKTIDLGEPIDNTKILILDLDLKEVSKGESGEICISGDCLAKGYKNNSELTNKAFIYLKDIDSRIYKTGDLGKYSSNGDLLYLGRIDNQVKLRGYRIELECIEAYINSMKDIRNSLVSIVEYNGDKNLVVFYTADTKVQDKTFIAFLSSKIARYMIPQKYVKIDQFDLTTNGKINRALTLEHNKKYLQDDSKADLNSEDIGEVEADIIKVISKRCLNNNIRLNDSLSDIIDSIKFISIVVELEEKFDIEFDDEVLELECFNDVKSLSKYIKRKMES